MNSYTWEAARMRMNELTQSGIPFIFIIDYDGKEAFVEPAEEVDGRECLFAFGAWSNANGMEIESRRPIEWRIDPPEPEVYKAKFDRVMAGLREGNSFLTNLTCRVPIHTNLSMYELFFRSEAKYRLWLKDRMVCFSPETFIRIEGEIISSYPMKGTLDASLPDAKAKLMNDEKEAAEHATIVDLIRNDLSIVADQVHVRKYRYIDRLKTNKGDLLQTSSEICGRITTDFRGKTGDLIFSQLPAGSITGAPKIKTMQIIEEAEGYRRGFYTGVMGYWSDGRLDSAVMIRFIDCEDDSLFFKAGGGITAKSRWNDEYEEVIRKIYVPIY